MIALALIAYCAIMVVICLGGAAALFCYALAAPVLVARRRAKMLRERQARVDRIDALDLAILLRAERDLGTEEHPRQPNTGRTLFSFQHDGPRIEPHRIQEN